MAVCETYTKVKDPSDVMDYSFDYATLGWLEDDDTVTSSSWSAESGVTIVSSSFNTTITSVLVSGGTAGYDYVVTNTISTANGLTKQTSFTLRVRER